MMISLLSISSLYPNWFSVVNKWKKTTFFDTLYTGKCDKLFQFFSHQNYIILIKKLVEIFFLTNLLMWLYLQFRKKKQNTKLATIIWLFWIFFYVIPKDKLSKNTHTPFVFFGLICLKELRLKKILSNKVIVIGRSVGRLFIVWTNKQNCPKSIYPILSIQ